MLSRRRFLDVTAASLLLPTGCVARTATPASQWVNDIHSQLNRTAVREVQQPRSLESLQAILQGAGTRSDAVSIAGGRHAMGGQQFVTDGTLLDMTAMNRVLRFDSDAGLIEVEAGIEWPDLLDYLWRVQQDGSPQWSIVQKQTSAFECFNVSRHRGAPVPPLVGRPMKVTLGCKSDRQARKLSVTLKHPSSISMCSCPS